MKKPLNHSIWMVFDLSSSSKEDDVWFNSREEAREYLRSKGVYRNLYSNPVKYCIDY